jgi:hypothetical protein
MSCSTLNINKSLLAAAVGASVLIVIGNVEINHYLDKQGAGLNKVGLAILFLGWVLLSILVSTNKQTGKFDHSLFLKKGLPALVVFAAAIVSHKLMEQGGGMKMVGASGLYLAAWVLFASMLVHADTSSSSVSQKKEKGLLIYGGAALINVSMLALNVNRKYNGLTGKWDGPENVFGMGLPLLMLGWVSVCMGISLC